MAQLAGAAFGAANALRQQQQDTISLQDLLMQRALQERQMLLQQARDNEQRRQFDTREGREATEFAAGQGNADRLFGFREKEFDSEEANRAFTRGRTETADRKIVNLEGVRQKMMEGLRQPGANPVDIQRQAFGEGVEIPDEIADPGKEQRDRMVQIRAMGDNALRVAQTNQSGALERTLHTRTNKPPTGVERRTLGFFNRALQSDRDVEPIEDEVSKMNIVAQGRMAYAPNFMQSQTGQLYTQAQKAFTEARLRKDSGAAIPPYEYENDRKTYFAQPGDSPATLSQKRRSRAAILASLASESGNALGEFYGDEAEVLLQSFKTRSSSGDTTRTPQGNEAGDTASKARALIEKYRPRR